MEDMVDQNKEFISVWVCDPRIHRMSFWRAHIDYGICLHTNSMCLSKKTSYVRRRYSEFVWLRQKLQDNALLVQLPKLPSANPFFSLNSTLQITQRMDGLHKFLEAVLKMPLLLSDSHLHLFLQSRLSIAKMEACVQGHTHYTVAQAIQCSVYDLHIPLEDESKRSCDSDSKSTSLSVLSQNTGSLTPIKASSKNGSLTCQFLVMDPQPESFKCLSSSSDNQQDMHS